MNYMIIAKDMKNRKVLKIYIKYKKSYHIRRKLHEKNYEYIEIIAEKKLIANTIFKLKERVDFTAKYKIQIMELAK